MLIEPIKMSATLLEYCFDFPKVNARWRQHAVAICMDVSSAEEPDTISKVIAWRLTVLLPGTHKVVRSISRGHEIMQSIILQNPNYSIGCRKPMMILPYDVYEDLGMRRRLPFMLAKYLVR